jgi:hypothetical protein
VCGGSRRYGGYSGYGSYASPSYSSSGGSRSGTGYGGSGGPSGTRVKPRWSPAGSSVIYTPTEIRVVYPHLLVRGRSRNGDVLGCFL